MYTRESLRGEPTPPAVYRLKTARMGALLGGALGALGGHRLATKHKALGATIGGLGGAALGSMAEDAQRPTGLTNPIETREAAAAQQLALMRAANYAAMMGNVGYNRNSQMYDRYNGMTDAPYQYNWIERNQQPYYGPYYNR